MKVFFWKEIKEKFIRLDIYLYIIITLILMLLNIWNYKSNYELYLSDNNDLIKIETSQTFESNQYLQDLLMKALTQQFGNYDTTSKDKTYKLNELVFSNIYVKKPLSDFYFISKSINENFPNGLEFNIFNSPRIKQYDNQWLFNSNLLDWNNIMIVFISLICFIFTFNSISGEKSNGTLKLILANNCNRWQVLLAKYLANIFVIAIPLIVLFVISMLVLIGEKIILVDFNSFLIFIFYFTGVLIFISLNILIGIWISSVSKKPIISISILLIIWLFLFNIIPNNAWLLSKTVKYVPSMEEFLNNVQNKAIELENNIKEGHYWDTKWNNEPPNPNVISRMNYVNNLTKMKNNLYVDYNNSLFNQAKIAIFLSSISPYSVYSFYNQKISDDGIYGFLNFYDYTNNYRDRLRDFYTNKDKTDSKSYHLFWNEDWSSKNFLSDQIIECDEIPVFAYKPSSADRIFSQIINNLTILIAWNLLIFILLFISIHKYDVR